MKSHQVIEAFHGWIMEHVRMSDSGKERLPEYIEQVSSILETIVVRNPNDRESHFGICSNCEGPERIYLSEYKDFNARHLCEKCLVTMLQWSITDIALGAVPLQYRWNSFCRVILGKFIKPILPITDQTRQMCPACTRVVLFEAESTTLNYQGRLATFAGQEYMFHRECSYECQRCVFTFGNAVRNPNGWQESSRDEVQQRFNDNPICNKCLEELSSEDDIRDCSECGVYVFSNYLHYDEHNDAEYCRRCYRELWHECDDCGREYSPSRGRHSCYRGIHNYAHKPNPIFHGKAPYYFGIELEVEQTDSDLSIDSGVTVVENTLGKRAYMKEDGSLDNGFEIVTHPHSLDEFQQSINWGFLNRLKDEGFRSWDTSSCGLHVHISRSAFSDDSHLVRFMKLIYDNKGAVRNLAGRSSDYARFNDSSSSGGVGLYNKVKNNLTGDGHFSAVNTDNCDTVEVRVFRGSLRKERVLSAIEFCHALVEHTRNMKITPKERPLSWTKFLSFMVKESVRYPNLNLIMESTLNQFNTRQPRDNEDDN